jgi:hypothetical protein
MVKHIAAILIIFFGVSIAWAVLGGTVERRTSHQDTRLKEEVGQLWGASQNQKAPLVYFPSYQQKMWKWKRMVAKYGKPRPR